MKSFRPVVAGGTILALAAVMGALLPSTVQAQEAELDRERLTQFAKAHVGLTTARDDFHGKVGRVHDEDGRRRAREELVAQVAKVLAEQEMTQEEYDEITLTISLNGEVRAMFDEILATLATQGTADQPPVAVGLP
ncbi:MAG: hypothetical protein O2958_09410 [Gemmatimonadetes bacterium]|nr:hypothetical protein [Gemmatimonadota bacterium]MDA1103527.1 hypothetical protein [Gemmatimonadota bacterium]